MFKLSVEELTDKPPSYEQCFPPVGGLSDKDQDVNEGGGDTPDYNRSIVSIPGGNGARDDSDSKDIEDVVIGGLPEAAKRLLHLEQSYLTTFLTRNKTWPDGEGYG